MAKALKLGIGYLLAEFLAYAFVFFFFRDSAGAVAVLENGVYNGTRAGEIYRKMKNEK